MRVLNGRGFRAQVRAQSNDVHAISPPFRAANLRTPNRIEVAPVILSVILECIAVGGIDCVTPGLAVSSRIISSILKDIPVYSSSGRDPNCDADLADNIDIIRFNRIQYRFNTITAIVILNAISCKEYISGVFRKLVKVFERGRGCTNFMQRSKVGDTLHANDTSRRSPFRAAESPARNRSARFLQFYP